MGYGAEAGHMDPLIRKMCARFCHDSLIITRNEESRSSAARTGSADRTGHRYRLDVRAASRRVRTQGSARTLAGTATTPVLVVCPINPFEWPVKASVAKAGCAHSDRRVQRQPLPLGRTSTIPGRRRIAAYEHYLTSIANAVDAFRKQRKVFVIMVATERLDARPASRISEKLGGVPVLTSDDYNMYELVSILRGLPHDGFVALSRDRDFDAGAGAVGGNHHGRTHPQPDARAWS